MAEEQSNQSENFEENHKNPNDNSRSNEHKTDEKYQHSYEDIIKKIGFGRVQKKIMTMSALLILMNMNELLGISVISIAAHCEFEMNHARSGVVNAIGLWGKLSSSFLWGFLSDKIGRKTILIYSIYLTCIFSIISMFMPNYWTFIVFRFIVGVCTGGVLNVTLTYLGEFLIPNERPFLMNYVSMSSGVSYVYLSICAYAVLETDWYLQFGSSYIFHPWRLLILFNLLPGILALFLLFRIPESPKLLLALGKKDAAYKIVDWICRQNHNGRGLHEFQVFEIANDSTEIIIPRIKGKILREFHDSLRVLRLPHVWNFIGCCIILTATYSVSFALGLWYPVIQNDMIFYTNKNFSETMCDVIIRTDYKTEKTCDDHIADKSMLEDFCYGAIDIVAYIFLGMIITVTRPKLVLICLLSLGGACGLALLKLSNGTLVMICFSFYLVFADLSSSTLLNLMIELMPTQLCAQASCLALTIGRISASLATYIIGLFLHTQCTATFLIFAALVLISAFFANLLSPKLSTNKNEKKNIKEIYFA